MGPLFDLNSRVILVTGSGGGLGYTMAKGLAQAGAFVVLNGRNEEKLEAAVNSLKNENLTVVGVPFDINDEKQVQSSIVKIEKDLGPIDVLVNNAGIQHRGSLETIEKKDFDKVIETNLIGAFLVSKHVVKGMIKRQKGKIINICSLMSSLGRYTVGPYAAAKGGLAMLTKAMAVDWGQYNIQVNGIAPGYFITEMTQPLADDPEFDTWLKKRTPANRWGDPTELIGTAIYLSTQASAFVNGQVIYVDGGIMASI